MKGNGVAQSMEIQTHPAVEPAVRIIRLANRRVFRLEPVASLLQRAFTRPPFPSWDEATDWLERVVEREEVGIWVAREGNELTGIAIGVDDGDIWRQKRPLALYLWAEKAPESKRALLTEMAEWFAERGHEKFWGLNGSPFDDGEWVERLEVYEPENSRTLVEFSLKR